VKTSLYLQPCNYIYIHPGRQSHQASPPCPSLHLIPRPTPPTPNHPIHHGHMVRKSTLLLLERTGLQANLQGGKSLTQQKQTRCTCSSTCCKGPTVIAIGSDIYKLFISGIVPRPIAFVSTINEEGVENLAPFR